MPNAIDGTAAEQLCENAIANAIERHRELQSTGGDLSHLDACVAMECLGNALLSAADFAHSWMCAYEEVDRCYGSRPVYNARRAGVGVLLTALDMRAAAARSPFDMHALSAHSSAIGEVCETHNLDAEDCRRFIQLADVKHGEGNVRELRKSPT